MKPIFFLPIGTLLLLVGCNPRPATVEYNPTLNFPAEQTIPCRILDSTFLFSFPQQIEVVGSWLVVLDSYQKDTCLHLFDTTGHHHRSFGLKGKGPGEIVDPTNFVVSKDGTTLYLYDGTLNKIVGYEMNSVLSGERILCTEYPVYPERIARAGAYTMLLQLCGYEPSTQSFLFQGNDDHFRFGHFTPELDSIYPLYTEYPPILETGHPQEAWAVWGYSATARMSPDGTHLAHSTYIGGLLEIFDRHDGRLTSRALRAIYPPRYRVIEGVVPAWIAWNETTTIGFEDIVVTDRQVYGLLNGSPGDAYKYPNQISVFDWDGNPVERYTTDRPLSALAVDEMTGRIYALTHEAEPRLILIDRSAVR